MANFTLHYGRGEQFDCEIDDQIPAWHHAGPELLCDTLTQIQAALETPLEYPRIDQAVLADDRVVIVVDPDTPNWIEVVAELRKLLQQAGNKKDAIRVALNRELSEQDIPANLSPDLVGTVVSYAEVMKGRQVYVASTAEGERIYLPEEIGEADVVISVGLFSFDDLWGYRGTHSVVYPAFAAQQQREKFHTATQQKLTPETSRGTRQTIDEIGWLLGLQYTVQVIPTGSGKLGHILSGACDAVFREAVDLLDENWRVQISERVETLIVTLPDEPGCEFWNAITRTCQSAKTLVETDGRVMLLTNIKELPREFTDPLTMCGNLDEVLEMVDSLKTPEAKALYAIADLAQTAKLYLLSQLDQDVVENLFCIPLSTHEEMQNAIHGGASYGILEGGPFVYVEID